VIVAFRVAGRDGTVPVICMLWGSALVLTLGETRTEIDLSSIVMPPPSAPSPQVAEAMLAGLAVDDAPARPAGDAPPAPEPRVGFEVGDSVRVIDGPYANFFATIDEVDAEAQTLKVSVSTFGRAASVVLDVARVEKTVPALFLIYAGKRHRVTTHQFVIGRDPASCDLALRDGNVSRKHAAVIHRNGAYYLKDLGSTNGIHYKGMRIDNKRIDEGDAFQLGDHEVRFTYRAGG
jgi:hypothetical protein